MTAPLPTFSVIIPTYNRVDRLRVCLEGFTLLNYPRDRYEIIVVDDGGLEVPKAAIAPFQATLQIRLVRIPHGGPASARNMGAREATGEFLAFIDDDCIPSPDWLQKLAQGLRRVPDGLVGGHTLNALQHNPYSTASQALIDYLYAYYSRAGRQGSFFTANNMAVASKAYEEMGGFDTSFIGPAGEDRDLCDRWLGRGGNLCYVDDAVVYHANALSLRSFWRQHAGYGRAAYHVHRLRAIRRGRRIHFEPPSFYARLVTYPRQAGMVQGAFVAGLLLLAQVSHAIGYYREAVRARLARRDGVQAVARGEIAQRRDTDLATVDLHVLYLSVTSDILNDPQHFRRIYLRGLGARVAHISYLVWAPPGTDQTPQSLGPNVALFPIVSTNRWQYIRQAFLTALRLHSEHPFDLAVCMTPIAPAAAAYWFRRRTGVPFIVHWSHDFLGGWGWRLESPAHMLYWPWLRWIARRADGVRPIAQPLADSILRGRVTSQRVRILPTLLNRDIFVPRSHECSAPSPFTSRPSGERQLLFVGRLAKQKNLPLLLQATAELKRQGQRVHLWIVGDGELRESLQRLAMTMGLAEAITFVGNVPLTKLQPYYAHCDVFILPSNHEGLARVLAEASFCEAPIVCTQVGGIVDHVRHGHTALVVPPGDLHALTTAIAAFVDDPERARRFGHAARTLVERQYPPIEQQYDRWVAYWTEVAACSGKPTRSCSRA